MKNLAGRQPARFKTQGFTTSQREQDTPAPALAQPESCDTGIRWRRLGCVGLGEAITSLAADIVAHITRDKGGLQ